MSEHKRIAYQPCIANPSLMSMLCDKPTDSRFSNLNDRANDRHTRGANFRLTEGHVTGGTPSNKPSSPLSVP